MRKRKPDNLKAVNMTVSMPESLRDYCSDHMEPSALLQRAVAEEILDMSFIEHWTEYRKTEKTAEYKPEEPAKSFIRAARWVLESEIRSGFQSSDRVWLEVYWKLTYTSTICYIDLDVAGHPGFVHVIFDKIYEEMPVPSASSLPFVTGQIPMYVVDTNPYKVNVLSAWLKHSWVGAA